jgi:hypothetical protein
MAYLRPRQENIFDNFGLNPEYDYGFDSGSPGMSPSDLPPVNDPFYNGAITKDPYANMWGQRKQPSPVDFGQGGFNPDISVPSQPTPEVPGTQPEIDMWERMQRMYKPDTYATDRLNRLLDTAPQTRGPGLGRGLIAASMALGNRPTAEIEAFKQAPYLREMADWKAKAEPYEKAAGLENQRNIQERTLVGQMAQYQTQAEKNAATDRNTQRKNDIAEMRARAYAWKQTHPDYDWFTDGPTIILKKPGSQEIIDTKIPTGNMSEQDLQILKNKGNVAAAEARGTAATELETTRQSGRPFQINGKTYVMTPDGAVEVSGLPQGTLTKPGTPRASDTKPETAKEYNDQEQIKIRKLVSTYPWAQKFFTQGPANTIVLKPRDKVADKESWDKVNKELNPSYVPPPKVEDKGVLGPTLDWLKNKFSGGTSTAPYDPSGGTPGSDYGTTPKQETAPSAPKQAPMKPTGNVMGGAPTPDIPESQRVPAGALRQKAIGALLERKEQITESNIKYVVEKGLVR